MSSSPGQSQFSSETELDASFLSHKIVMARPILSESGWRNRIDLVVILVEEEGELYPGMRVLVCDHSRNPNEPTLWVPGGLRIDDEFGELQRSIYSARSLFVQERAD